MLFITPFARLFPFLLEDTTISLHGRAINFTCIFLAAIIFLIAIRRMSTKLIALISVLALLQVLNYFATEHASLKWFFNWFGFVFIFGVIYQFLHCMSEKDIAKFNLIGKKIMGVAICVVGLVALMTWISDFGELLRFTSLGMPNNVINLLTINAGVEKQALGNFTALAIIFIFSCRKDISVLTYLLVVVSILVILPASIGVRTITLGLSLFILIKLTLSSKISLLLSVLVSVPALLYLVIDWDAVATLLQNYYDRWSSVMAAISMLPENILGVGNGGYPIYIQENNEMLLYKFGSESMIRKDQFWIAPESDIAYFIGSWGVLSLVFFLLVGYIAYMAIRLLNDVQVKLYSVEKVILGYTSVLIIMGISQDNAGSILWWVYLGAALGVIERYRFRVRPLIFRRISANSIK